MSLPKLGMKDPDNHWRTTAAYRAIHKEPKEGNFTDLIDLAHLRGCAGWAFWNAATKKFYGCQNTNDLGLFNDLDEDCRCKLKVIKIVQTNPSLVHNTVDEPLDIYILDEGLADVDGVTDDEMTLDEVIQELTECHYYSDEELAEREAKRKQWEQPEEDKNNG